MFNKFFITVDGGKGNKKLRKLMKKLFAELNTKIDEKMANVNDTLNQLNERLGTSLAGIASDLRTLNDQIQNGTVTPESMTRLTQITEAFEALDAQLQSGGSGTGDEGNGEGDGTNQPQ